MRLVLSCARLGAVAGSADVRSRDEADVVDALGVLCVVVSISERSWACEDEEPALCLDGVEGGCSFRRERASLRR